MVVRRHAKPEAGVRFPHRALAAVPWWCWLWTALALYLAACWLVFGPLISRQYIRDHLKEYWRGELLPAPLIWITTPLWLPLEYLLLRPLVRLLYPPEARPESEPEDVRIAREAREKAWRARDRSGDSSPF